MLLKPLVASLDPKSKEQTDAAAVVAVMAEVVSGGGSISVSLVLGQWLRYASEALDLGLFKSTAVAVPATSTSSSSEEVASPSPKSPEQQHLVVRLSAAKWASAFAVHPSFLPKVLFDMVESADGAKFREDSSSNDGDISEP